MQIQSNFGWMGPDPIDILVTNRRGSAVAVGDVLILDIGKVDAASTSNSVGSSAAGLANIVAVTTALQPYAVYGHCLQAAGDDVKLRFRLRGQSDAVACSAAVVLSGATRSVVLGPTNTAVTGQVLAGNSASILDITSASAGKPTKIIFLPLTAIGAAGTTDGWFDGINGFGSVLIVPN